MLYNCLAISHGQTYCSRRNILHSSIVVMQNNTNSRRIIKIRIPPPPATRAIMFDSESKKPLPPASITNIVNRSFYCAHAHKPNNPMDKVFQESRKLALLLIDALENNVINCQPCRSLKHGDISVGRLSAEVYTYKLDYK